MKKDGSLSQKLNKIHHSDFMNNGLPDKSASLILADPPYYCVKGDFDFIWESFEDYLKDVERWAIECKRVLADNGTLFWYGDSHKIAYAQIILDKHFTLINNLVWNKGSFMGLEESAIMRSFAPCTERILCYGSQVQDITGLQFVEKEYVAPRNPFAIALRDARAKKGCGINAVAEYGKFYGKVNHGGAVTNWERGYNIPDIEQWEKLCEFLPDLVKDYGTIQKQYLDLRAEYDSIRREYENKRRYFVNQFKLQEILNFSNESQKTGKKYDHETVKPETLTRALILTCSRESDLILVPFAGSGTECAMAAREGRNFIGYDLVEKNVIMSNKRTEVILQSPRLI